MFGDLFYQLGSALGGLAAHLPGKGGAANVDPGVDGGYDADDDDAPAELVTGAVAAWFVGRLLRPRPLRWGRVILAGVAATALAELVGRTLERDLRPGPGRDLEEGPEQLLARLGAGLAVTAGYASIVYPRLPGSPFVRGMAFGVLDVAAAPRGGLVGVASTVPGLRFPLQGLAVAGVEAQGPLSRLAFGVGLGVFYRDED